MTLKVGSAGSAEPEVAEGSAGVSAGVCAGLSDGCVQNGWLHRLRWLHVLETIVFYDVYGCNQAVNASKNT